LKESYPDLIKKALQNDNASQYALYKSLLPRVMGVCRRYLRHKEEAEDCAQEVFIKIFKNLPKYNGDGPFEAWVRRITVNEALTFIRKNSKINFNEDVEDHQESVSNGYNALSDMQHQELLELLNKLPEGKRMVFNMYAIEGYSHKEIGEILNITENTSRSQFFKARDTLAGLLNKNETVS
jgi:RNA polymerase sigma factor (sigma-70 family)